MALSDRAKTLLLGAIGDQPSTQEIITLLEAAGTGNMTGPVSSTDNALARYDGLTGTLLKNSGVTLNDSGNLAGVGTLNTSGLATLGSLSVTDGIVSSPALTALVLRSATTTALTLDTSQNATFAGNVLLTSAENKTIGTMTTGVGANRPSKGYAAVQWVAGNLGTNSLSPSVLFSAIPGFGVAGNNSAGVSTDTYGVGVSGEFAHFHARGTNTAPAAIQTNDLLGGFGVAGYNGSTWQIEAGRRNFVIQVIANEAFTPSAMGTRVNFNTIANGSTTQTNRIQIDGNGNTRINNGNLVINNTGMKLLFGNNGGSDIGNFGSAQPGNIYSQISVNSGEAGNPGTFQLFGGNGTFAAPTAALNGDLLGQLSVNAYDSTDYFNDANLFAYATENFSPTAHGTKLVFQVTPNTTNTPVDALTIDQNKNLLSAGGLGVGNSAAATTPGTVTRKMQVFNAAGVSLGFVAIYDAIT